MPFYPPLIHKLSNKHSDLACQKYEESTQGLERNTTVGSKYRKEHKGKRTDSSLIIAGVLGKHFPKCLLALSFPPLFLPVFFLLYSPIPFFFQTVIFWSCREA